LAEFSEKVVPTLARVIKPQWETKRLQNPMIRTQFFTWYADKTWGEGWDKPSGEELLEMVSPC
jgi:hypothetical protein